jgi:hypothetical protein
MSGKRERFKGWHYYFTPFHEKTLLSNIVIVCVVFLFAGAQSKNPNDLQIDLSCNGSCLMLQSDPLITIQWYYPNQFQQCTIKPRAGTSCTWGDIQISFYECYICYSSPGFYNCNQLFQLAPGCFCAWQHVNTGNLKFSDEFFVSSMNAANSCFNNSCNPFINVLS